MWAQSNVTTIELTRRLAVIDKNWLEHHKTENKRARNAAVLAIVSLIVLLAFVGAIE